MGTNVKEADVTTGAAADTGGDRPARSRILEAALATFSAQGYAQASMLEIATRARVSKRELYALVGNKHELLVACITERATRLQLPDDLPEPTDRASLELALTGFGERLVLELSQPAVLGVFRLAIAEAERAPEIARTLDELARSAVRGELQQIMEGAQARGLLSGAPAEMVRLFMALLWDGLLVNLLLGTVAAPSAEKAAALAQRTTTVVMQVHGRE